MNFESFINSYLLQIRKKLAVFFINGRVKSKHQYLISLSLICLASFICFLFHAYINPEVAAFSLLLILSVIAMFFDILPVLFSAVLSAFAWDFLFLPPRFQFFVGKPEDVVTLCMYFIIAMVSAVFTYKIRQVEKIVRQEEEKAKTYKLYDTILNSLSHEFRTPLATIIAATDNLLLNTPDLTMEDKNNLLTEISIAALRLNQQVGNLLNMSRLESGFIQPKKTWCDINDLIYDVLKRFDQVSEHRIEINVNEDLPLFKLDYGLMQQLLYNLIDNAKQYTRVNSVITINAACSGENLVLKIEDNGSGFPEEEIKNVFQKFYRLPHSKAGGIGLGLSIAKGFAEAQDGTIELENILPSGARFTIKIPSEKNLLKPVKNE